MKLLPAAIVAFTLLSSVPATADDQTNFAFDDGSVIIHCAALSKEQQVDSAVFLEAFPLWITNLQNHANKGTVARAHYLNELKQGVFVVVLGKNKEEAMQNALTIQEEHGKILQDAMTAAGVDDSGMSLEASCDLIEIGPVAVKPIP